MATYYRWRRSTVTYTEQTSSVSSGYPVYAPNGMYASNSKPGQSNGYYVFSNSDARGIEDVGSRVSISEYCAGQKTSATIFKGADRVYQASTTTCEIETASGSGNITCLTIVATPGTFVDYVYSTSSSAYPNGGVQGNYYYDQRTTVTSPTAPTGLTYPATITEPSVSVSWTAATSNTNYPVSGYQVDVSTNGGSSWATVGTPTTNSFHYDIPAGTTSIMFRVRAKDSNNQWGAYMTGTEAQVLLSLTLTVPEMVMQGQQATISWTAIEGADSYTVQRKSSADADWTQVYSGADTTFAETVGAWTSLQYRVQAVFGETAGGWATSDPIQIVSASALVISGTDGDLGTLVNDVSYVVSSDGTNPLTVVESVNGVERTFTATNGATNRISVVDLPTGTGTITITASTNPGSGVISVTRSWTYSKAAITFPDAGSVADLTQQGKTIWAKTIAEAVRTPGIWGGNLGLALSKLAGSVLYNRNQVAKYAEVTVSLAGKSEGDIISLPENGVMTEFYVAKLDYESGLNGAGRTLLVRKNAPDEEVKWNGAGQNAFSGSTLDTWLNETYKTRLTSEVQAQLGTTQFYYTPGNGTTSVTTLSRAIFPLSATELGAQGYSINVEGAKIDTLAALPSSGARWTRSPDITTNNTAIAASYGGGVAHPIVSSSAKVWVAFTLPSTFTYGPVFVATDGTVHDEQEYEEAGTFTDISGGTIPMVSIETGSYVGTGTYGSNNQNVLRFSFKPSLVFISCGNPSSGTVVPILNGSNSAVTISDLENDKISLSWGEKSVFWWNTSSAKKQLNTQNPYYYVAIGLGGDTE